MRSLALEISDTGLVLARDGAVVAIEPAGVAASLEHYMQRSEQLDTRLWLAADDDRAAGVLVQKLPGREEADEERLFDE